MTRTPTLSRWILVLTVVAGICAFVLVTRSSGVWSTPTRALAALPHGAWFSPYTAPVGEPFVATLADDRVRWAGTYDNATDRFVYHFGLSEKPVLALMTRLADAFGGEMVDVGAHVGNHTLFMAPRVDVVHAVEPWPPVLARLRRNLELNPEITNVVVHPVGFGSTPGTLSYHPPPEGLDSIGSFDPDFLPAARPAPIPLPLVRGDDHLREAGVGRIGLVKCDTEGFDRHALGGLGALLRRDRPAVVFELSNTEGGFRTHDELEATFPPDYVFRRIELEPNWMLDFVVVGWHFGPDATGRYELGEMELGRGGNGLALPAERSELLETL